MTYRAASGGDGWQMVPCMMTFLDEVEHCVDLGLLDVTNLGQLGDAVHKAEPTSRHNPARGPDGNWYVAAADFGGRDYQLLFAFHQDRYRQHDARLYRYGFSQRGDGYGLHWFDGDVEWTGRDQGHCHFDVNMFGPQLGRNWWVPALALTTPWGLEAWLRNRLGLAPATSTETFIPPPVTSEEDDMPTAILKPGESATLPVPASKFGSVLWAATDNTTQVKARDGAIAQRAALRVAVELAPGRKWVPAFESKTFDTSVPLGGTADDLPGNANSVSVVNGSPLVVTITVAARPVAKAAS